MSLILEMFTEVSDLDQKKKVIFQFHEMKDERRISVIRIKSTILYHGTSAPYGVLRENTAGEY